jgi:hypothetical protein
MSNVNQVGESVNAIHVLSVNAVNISIGTGVV